MDERIYQPEGGAIQTMPEVVKAPAKVLSKDERISVGKSIYSRTCQPCHQADGKGIANSFPPLANSDYFKGNSVKAINPIVHGLSGNITVNGKTFNSIMPKQSLSDEEIASVVTFILNSFGNEGGDVTPAQVLASRKTSNK